MCKVKIVIIVTTFSCKEMKWVDVCEALSTVQNPGWHSVKLLRAAQPPNPLKIQRPHWVCSTVLTNAWAHIWMLMKIFFLISVGLNQMKKQRERSHRLKEKSTCNITELHKNEMYIRTGKGLSNSTPQRKASSWYREWNKFQWSEWMVWS